MCTYKNAYLYKALGQEASYAHTVMGRTTIFSVTARAISPDKVLKRLRV